MSSEPRLSLQRGFTTAPAAVHEEQDSKRPYQYEPHLFDVVYALSKVKDVYVNIDIPTAYLQAASVDSARVVGHGASFTASVRSLPQGPATAETTLDMHGWTITTTSPAPPRPQYVLYKTARVAFADNGFPLPRFRAALQSVLTEFHALVYPPLFRHPNIIAFLGLAWGANDFDPAHRLPALVVEYAEYGTLADVLAMQNLSSIQAQSISYDVANGLQAIHSAGVVHGDIKAENILMCRGVQRMVAKLGDFGYSIVEEAEQEKLYVGGTWPWKAPEATDPIPLGDVYLTDIYSLGLLIWTISIGGINPFALLLDDINSSTVQKLKQSDDLYMRSGTVQWVPKLLPYIMNTFTQPARPSATLGGKIPKALQVATLSVENDLLLSLAQQGSRTYIGQHALFSKLDQVFSWSLRREARTRNLGAIVEVLRPGVTSAEVHCTRETESKAYRYTITNTSNYRRLFNINSTAQSFYATVAPDSQTDSVQSSGKVGTAGNAPSQIISLGSGEHSSPIERSVNGGSHIGTSQKTGQSAPHIEILETTSWLRRGYKHTFHSWQAMRDLSPRMQELVRITLVSSEDIPLRFLLAASAINGYGCRPDVESALALLRQCAEAGHPYSRANLYRLHRANKVLEVPGYDLTKHLDPMARIGARNALIDLKEAGMDKEASAADSWLCSILGGVGADWYVDRNMLYGLTLGKWMDYEVAVAAAKQQDNLSTYKINKHGDTLLHLTASCALHKFRKFLVEEMGADINCRNDAGDTPLISACRAGIGPSAIVFLRTYKANASLAAANGETALHWLVSFPDATVEPLARDLIAQGAVVDATTEERVSHSVFNATVDVDFQMPGTPLQWAVHHDRPSIVKVLLSLGANPKFLAPEGRLTPLEWAAFFHHDECLRLMIQHLEEQYRNGGSSDRSDERKALTYGTLIRSAIHAADPFSMVLRNGHRYLDRLHATLDLLREKTKMIRLGNNFGSTGWTPLYYAVAGGHDEVVSYMLLHEWHINALNQTCGEAMRTPLLEAVRWKRLHLVKQLVEYSANIHSMARNPFNAEIQDWSALHVLAEEGFSTDDGVLSFLVECGLKVDAVSEESAAADGLIQLANLQLNDACTPAPSTVRIGESPLSCALRNNAFGLCDEFRTLGANVNYLSTTAGFYETTYPTTILGHVIVSNTRNSYERLKYLLSLEQTAFIVEPARQLTALHRAALGCIEILSVDKMQVDSSNFDWDTNRATMRQLVAKYGTAEKLNARCAIFGRTALHLAVQSGNEAAVEVLVDAEADLTIRDERGSCAGDLGPSMLLKNRTPA